MKVLYHECTDETGTEQQVEFLDGNGKLWLVPFGEPTEFENVFMADKILEHQAYMGLVEVHFTKTKLGITYDMEDAKVRAKQALLASEKFCIDSYVRTQLETRVRANFPPLPPVGRALTCVVKHRTNLLRYGLRPVGWEPPYEVEGGGVDPAIAMSAGTSISQSSMEERLQQMEKLLVAQQNIIAEFVKGTRRATGGVGAGGGKSSPRPPAVDILAADAAPSPASQVNPSEGSDDTYESIKL